MLRERGNQLYMVGGALLGVVLLIAALLWYVGAEREEAFAAGETAEHARWQARENEEVRMANAALVAAQARVAALERQAAAELAALDAHHQQEAARVQAERDAFLDDLVSGRVRFHAGIAAGQRACRNAEGAAAAAPSSGDGGAQARLPDALQSAVAGGAKLAAEADAVVEQLTLAQGVIRTYLKTCSER